MSRKRKWIVAALLLTPIAIAGAAVTVGADANSCRHPGRDTAMYANDPWKESQRCKQRRAEREKGHGYRARWVVEDAGDGFRRFFDSFAMTSG